jgi:hypothetical protein
MYQREIKIIEIGRTYERERKVGPSLVFFFSFLLSFLCFYFFLILFSFF